LKDFTKIKSGFGVDNRNPIRGIERNPVIQKSLRRLRRNPIRGIESCLLRKLINVSDVTNPIRGIESLHDLISIPKPDKTRTQ